MQLLTCSSLKIAEFLERKAFALCVAEGNKGGRWSEIFTDENSRYAIVWDGSVAAAFTEEEIVAGLIDSESEAGVNWTVYTPPAPDTAG